MLLRSHTHWLSWFNSLRSRRAEQTFYESCRSRRADHRGTFQTRLLMHSHIYIYMCSHKYVFNQRYIYICFEFWISIYIYIYIYTLIFIWLHIRFVFIYVIYIYIVYASVYFSVDFWVRRSWKRNRTNGNCAISDDLGGVIFKKNVGVALRLHHDLPVQPSARNFHYASLRIALAR